MKISDDCCVLKLFYLNEAFSLQINVMNTTSTQLVDRLFQVISEYEQSINKSKTYNTSHIQGFKTKDKHFIIDYILSKQNLGIYFLRRKELAVVPLYRESKINSIYNDK